MDEWLTKLFGKFLSINTFTGYGFVEDEAQINCFNSVEALNFIGWNVAEIPLFNIWLEEFGKAK